jgi:hypothetical protein
MEKIKVSDLRIGNYIISGNNGEFDPEQSIGKVVEIGNETSENKQVYCDCDEYYQWFFKDNYFGIPLTEEWFIKFGFRIKDKKSRHNTPIFYIGALDINYCFSYADFRDDFGFYVEYTDSPLESDTDKEYPVSFGVKYVHQLQNLYFALTSEELISVEKK